MGSGRATYRAESDAAGLGPWPDRTVAALRDLGLSDSEIARYFRVPTARIARLAGSAAPCAYLPRAAQAAVPDTRRNL